MQAERFQQPVNDTHICPLCGMALHPHQVAATVTYIGHTHFFCSDECYQRFRRKPEAFLVDLAHADDPHLGYPCPHQAVALVSESRALLEDERRSGIKLDPTIRPQTLHNSFTTLRHTETRTGQSGPAEDKYSRYEPTSTNRR